MIYKRGMTLDDIKKQLIIYLLIEHKGNKTRVHEEMGITCRTLYNLMIKYEIPYNLYRQLSQHVESLS